MPTAVGIWVNVTIFLMSFEVLRRLARFSKTPPDVDSGLKLRQRQVPTRALALLHFLSRLTKILSGVWLTNLTSTSWGKTWQHQRV
mmetsp:Transcript_10014/g.26595  ORF Transcript_10014/g.26595 Transcript_10014/m.26595 type:complete len:86 (+) Transcript_10014:165-422(+)